MSAGPDTQPKDDEGAAVVFICGALRSGTTLLRIMVNHHPLLSNPGEMDFLFEPMHEKNGAPNLERYLHEISFNRVFRKIGFNTKPELGHIGMIRDMVDQLHRSGLKLSINIHRNFSRIPEFFPDARFIHLVRDPRDVARSSIGMGWAGNVYHGVDHWILSEQDFERLAAQVPETRILRLRNEALITDPAGELSRVCSFFGVEYDPEMLAYPETTTYAAPDPALIFQWRRQLSPREIGLVEGKIGRMLTDRGYEPSGHSPIRPGLPGRLTIAVSHRWNRWRLMAKRHGTLLLFTDMIARRLPPSPFTDFVRRRRAKRAANYLQ